jgi:hypothetical protein
MSLTTDNARKEIIELHNGIMQSARRSVQDAIKIGEIISGQKQLLPHGEFLPWVGTLPFEQRTAYKYLSLSIHSDKVALNANLQDAYRQLETIEQQEKQTEEQRKRSMISEYRKTGIKPAGWDRSLDYIIQKDKENEKKYHEEKNRLEAERLLRAEQRKKEEQASDMFTDALNIATDEIINKHKQRTEWKDKIRVSDTGKDDAFMDAIIDYLDTLPNDNRRIEACNNIIKICRNISVELQKIK